MSPQRAILFPLHAPTPALPGEFAVIPLGTSDPRGPVWIFPEQPLPFLMPFPTPLLCCPPAGVFLTRPSPQLHGNLIQVSPSLLVAQEQSPQPLMGRSTPIHSLPKVHSVGESRWLSLQPI